MADITTLNGTDLISDSRAVINTNFSNLNAGLPTSMTVSAFDTETTTGTLNPEGRSVVYLSDSLYTCVWNGSAWEYYYAGCQCVPPSLTTFTLLNETSGSVTGTYSVAKKYAYIKAPKVGGENWRLLASTASLPGTPYNLTIAMQIQQPTSGSYATAGIWIGDSGATPKAQFWGPVTNDAGNVQLATYRMNSPTSYSGATSFAALNTMLIGPMLWLRLRDTGVNLEYYYSMNGQNWILAGSNSRTAFLTSPAQWGASLNAATSDVDAQSMILHLQAA